MIGQFLDLPHFLPFFFLFCGVAVSSCFAGVSGLL